MTSNTNDIETATAVPPVQTVTCIQSNGVMANDSVPNKWEKEEKSNKASNEEMSYKSQKEVNLKKHPKWEATIKPAIERTSNNDEVALESTIKDADMSKNEGAPVVHVDKPNPAAIIGAAAFAIGTWQMQWYNIGWMKGKSHLVYVGLFLCGIIQIITGLQSYAYGDYFSYVAFTMFGCFWVIKPFLVAYPIQFLPRTLPTSMEDACEIFPSDCKEDEFRRTEGSFVMMYAMFAGVLLASSLRRCLSIFLALINVTAGLMIITAGCFTEDEALREVLDKIGGWFLVGASACAMWASFADFQILMYGENAIFGPGPSVSSLIDMFYTKKNKAK